MNLIEINRIKSVNLNQDSTSNRPQMGHIPLSKQPSKSTLN